jgi:hypothetical protein
MSLLELPRDILVYLFTLPRIFSVKDLMITSRTCKYFQKIFEDHCWKRLVTQRYESGEKVTEKTRFIISVILEKVQNPFCELPGVFECFYYLQVMTSIDVNSRFAKSLNFKTIGTTLQLDVINLLEKHEFYVKKQSPKTLNVYCNISRRSYRKLFNEDANLFLNVLFNIYAIALSQPSSYVLIKK